MNSLRIGVDLGGTKIEAIALNPAGEELLRRRVATPAGDYERTLAAVRDLVTGFEDELQAAGFEVVEMAGGLAGEPLVEDGDLIGVIASPLTVLT